VNDAPIGVGRIAEEHARLRISDREKGMRLVDLLGEELGFRQHDLSDVWVICLISWSISLTT
jgi:hypothetical protein